MLSQHGLIHQFYKIRLKLNNKIDTKHKKNSIDCARVDFVYFIADRSVSSHSHLFLSNSVQVSSAQ